MAWTELRNGSRRVAFRYNGVKHSFTVGDVAADDAEAFCRSTEELLRLLKRKLITLPYFCPIERFMFYRGQPPENAAASEAKVGNLSLESLRDIYLQAQEKKLEQSTLDGMRLHFSHLTRILGGKRDVDSLTRPDLQVYVDKRSSEWIDPNVHRARRRELDATKKPRKNRKPPPQQSEDKPRRHPSSATIKKEIISLRTAWNWARRHLGLQNEFPGGGLDHAKTEEKLPFMSWDEATQRLKDGAEAEKVWDCVYLRPGEIIELLNWVRGRPISPWVFPMFVFAAYTGARRSEIIRILPSDLDVAGSVVTLREKKRVKNRLTTRRVPLTPFLKDVLVEWLKVRAKGSTLFCKGTKEEITPGEAHNYFWRALRLSKWSVLKGWHVFRHSYISVLASKGVDQRIIDAIVGHQTEEQRRRYRHLYPDVVQAAVFNAFS